MSDSNLRKHSTSEEKQKRVTLVTPLGKEELTVSATNERNWRGIFIALLVIVAVLGLIICSIFILSPLDDGSRIKGDIFTINSVIDNKFTPNVFNGTWISDIELVYRDHYGNIQVFCVENYTTRTLMTNTTFDLLKAVDYKVSADLNYVLVIKDVIKIWKFSFLARYFIYETFTQEYFPLSHKEGKIEEQDAPYLESVNWAPTGNGIAYIHDNNLYFKTHIRKEKIYQLTREGLDEYLIGKPDYLYETKILESDTAYWFSPDTAMIAYATFNSSLVEKFHYSYYGNFMYEEIRTIRYPKVGTKIPQVELIIMSLTFPKFFKKVYLEPPPIYTKDNEYYLTGVKWINEIELSVTWMNRKQNLTSILICKDPEWTCSEVYQLRDIGVNKLQNPIFNPENMWFLAILPFQDPYQDGSRGRFQELCQINRETGKLIYLTSPPMNVLEISSWDFQNHLVYFIGTLELGTRHLYRIGDKSSSQNLWDCLTCFYDNQTHVNNKNKTDLNNHYDFYNSFSVNESLDEYNPSPYCLFTNVYFSSTHNPKYHVLDCLGPDVPSNILFETETNSIVTVLDTNPELRKLYYSMARPKIRQFQVEFDSGYYAQVKLILPPTLTGHEDMKFPMIIRVVSSPGLQSVNEKFQVDWSWYLSGKNNYVIAEIDTQGKVEAEDHIAVTSYLSSTLKFVEKKKIGVFGQGYGGYLAGTMMSQDKDLFRCGIAVNPITNLLFTDPFSTEKYMGHPNDTEKMRAYEEADLNKKAGNLKDKQFLLVSGTADIDVPIQHSMHFIYNLVKENVIFKQQIYPDEDHYLSGVALHYHTLMDAFWKECFPQGETPEWDSLARFGPSKKK